MPNMPRFPKSSLRSLNQNLADQNLIPDLKITTPHEKNLEGKDTFLNRFDIHHTEITTQLKKLQRIESEIDALPTMPTEQAAVTLLGKLNKIGDGLDTLYAESDELLAASDMHADSPIRQLFAAEHADYESRINAAHQKMHGVQLKISREKRAKKALELLPEFPVEAEIIPLPAEMNPVQIAEHTIAENRQKLFTLVDQLGSFEEKIAGMGFENLGALRTELTMAMQKIATDFAKLARKNQQALNEAELTEESPLRHMVEADYQSFARRIEASAALLNHAETVIKNIEAESHKRADKVFREQLRTTHAHALELTAHFGDIENEILEEIAGSKAVLFKILPLQEQLKKITTDIYTTYDAIPALFKKFHLAEKNQVALSIAAERAAFMEREALVHHQLQQHIQRLNDIDQAMSGDVAAWNTNLAERDAHRLQENLDQTDVITTKLVSLAHKIKTTKNPSAEEKKQFRSTFDELTTTADSLHSERQTLEQFQLGDPTFAGATNEIDEYSKLVRNIDALIEGRKIPTEAEMKYQELLKELQTLQAHIQTQYIETTPPLAQFTFDEVIDPKTKQVVAREVTGIKQTTSALQRLGQLSKRLFGRLHPEEQQLAAKIRTYNNLLHETQAYEILTTQENKKNRKLTVAEKTREQHAIPVMQFGTQTKKSTVAEKPSSTDNEKVRDAWFVTPESQGLEEMSAAEVATENLRQEYEQKLKVLPQIYSELLDPATRLNSTSAVLDLLKQKNLIDIRSELNENVVTGPVHAVQMNAYELWPGEDVTARMTLFGKYNKARAAQYIKSVIDRMNRFVKDNE